MWIDTIWNGKCILVYSIEPCWQTEFFSSTEIKKDCAGNSQISEVNHGSNPHKLQRRSSRLLLMTV